MIVTVSTGLVLTAAVTKPGQKRESYHVAEMHRQAVRSRLYDETIQPTLHSIEVMLPAACGAKGTGWLSDAGP